MQVTAFFFAALYLFHFLLYEHVRPSNLRTPYLFPPSSTKSNNPREIETSNKQTNDIHTTATCDHIFYQTPRLYHLVFFRIYSSVSSLPHTIRHLRGLGSYLLRITLQLLQQVARIAETQPTYARFHYVTVATNHSRVFRKR